ASLRGRLDGLDPERLAAALGRLGEICAERMRRDGVAPAAVRVSRIAELRYVGQSYELQIPLPDGPVGSATLAACAERFHAAHAAIYGQSDPDGAVEMVSLRVQHRAALAS